MKKDLLYKKLYNKSFQKDINQKLVFHRSQSARFLRGSGRSCVCSTTVTEYLTFYCGERIFSNSSRLRLPMDTCSPEMI